MQHGEVPSELTDPSVLRRRCYEYPNTSSDRLIKAGCATSSKSARNCGFAVWRAWCSMVGLVRFELTTSCTPCKRATRLRYSPNKEGSQSVMRREVASAFSRVFKSLTHASGVNPSTTSNFAASSPAFAPGMGANGTMIESRTFPSVIRLSTPSFSFCFSPFT